jgi:hypothetical protein
MYSTLNKFKTLKKITLFVLLVLSCITSISVQYLANAQNTETSKPIIFVYFERQTIRQSDSLKAELRLFNNTGYSLNNVVVKFNKPDFIQVSQPSNFTLHCEDRCIDFLYLGSIQPHSTTSQKFCINTTSEVELGDYNLAFVVEYSWIEDNKIRQSFVSAEKPIFVKFFGSDSIAGIPLGIAGLVVPGLSCLLVLSWIKIPLIPELPLGEKLIYSLLVSIPILTIGNIFRSSSSNIISINILFVLSLIGAIIGGTIGGFYWLVKAIKTHRQQQLEIKSEDIYPKDGDYYQLLEKAIRLTRKSYSKIPKTEIMTLNDEKYQGTLAGNYSDKEYILIGWFAIESSERINNLPSKYIEKINLFFRIFIRACRRKKIKSCLENGKVLKEIRLARCLFFRKKIKSCLEKGKVLEAIRLAHDCGFKIIGEEKIKFAESKEFQTADEYVIKLPKNEVYPPSTTEDGDRPIVTYK